ncbi:hypothetical protein [Listeria seeligeri]|uniref:hypothetical protein n=1 Tax=Listeria seeligeri TaxID=1640 RepID=UPI0031CCA1BE
MAYEREIEKIYSEKTKTYMKEVISSYENKNYRSAVVMLYTVFLTDLCEKLSELKNIYSDQQAEKILKDVAAMGKKDFNREKTLIDKIKVSKPEIFDNDAIAIFEFLKAERNLCAHPSLDMEEIEPLSSPSREVVAGLIKGSIETLFSKSPYLGKQIFGNLLKDLTDKKDSLITDEAIESYFKLRYHDRFDTNIRAYIVEQLFKTTFIDKSTEAEVNRDFVYKLLLIMIKNDKTSSLNKIQDSKHFNNVNFHNPHQLNLLMNLISRYPQLYLRVNEHIKAKINDVSNIDTDPSKYVTNYYLNPDIKSHLKLINQEDASVYTKLQDLSNEDIKLLEELCIDEDCLMELYELGINIYANSYNYYKANYNFERLIEPFLDKYDVETILRLVTKVGYNNQCNDRRAAQDEHKQVVDKYYEICNEDEKNKLEEIVSYLRFFENAESVLEESN